MTNLTSNVMRPQTRQMICLVGVLFLAALALLQESLYLTSGKSLGLHLGSQAQIVLEESSHQPHLVLLLIVFAPMVMLKVLDWINGGRE